MIKFIYFFLLTCIFWTNINLTSIYRKPPSGWVGYIDHACFMRHEAHNRIKPLKKKKKKKKKKKRKEKKKANQQKHHQRHFSVDAT
jgi:hypothetical protein